MKVMVIDDDVDLLKLIENTLKKDYVVTVEQDAANINPNELRKFDLIVLDIMMPRMTGFDFLKQYRQMIDVPIILLTAKDFEKDKLEGFALGADDYITKPFSISELRARVAAHLRRENRQKHNRLVDYPVSCDLFSRKIYCDSKEIHLTSSEYDICELLLKNKGQVFSRETIYTTIYGFDAQGDSSTSITERIKVIRTKFVAGGVNPIKTIWGIGYKWEIEKV